MPRTSVVNQDMAQKAASIMIRAPMLTVREAMQTAGFSKEEASTKSMQQKVAWTLPGHGKRTMKMKTLRDIPLIELNCNDNSESSLSQLMDPSGMHHDEEDIKAWKPKKN